MPFRTLFRLVCQCFFDTVLASNFLDELRLEVPPDVSADRVDIPILREGGAYTEALLLGVEDISVFCHELVPESEKNMYFINMDTDEIFIFDSDTYYWLWMNDPGVDYDEGECNYYLMVKPVIPCIRDICTVESWSKWSDSNRNLNRLRTAIPRSFGVLEGEIMVNLLDHINDAVGRYAVANACPMETPYFAFGERYSPPAHCKVFPPRRSCDHNEKINLTAPLVKPRPPEL